nr:unnamed protein product [Callosobruchus analis]
MAPKKLKIIQWNARSFQANRHSFNQLQVEEEFDIALISETWFKSTHNINLKHFNVIRKDRANASGGVAIFISKALSYEIITFSNNFNQDIEVCGINALMDSYKISVISLYRPPNIRATSQDYINIFRHAKYDCIVGGDFNAHHGLWGSPITSTAGNILADALDSFQDYVVVNDGSATRMSPPGQIKSAVDVTIVSSKLCRSLNWSTLSDTYGSDHFPIKLVINDIYVEDNTIIPLSKWSMKEVDWNMYRSEIEKSFSTYPAFGHSNDMSNFLVNSITSAANKACKVLKPFSPRSRSPPWWDNQCTLSVNARKEALRTYKSNLTFDNFLEYKRLDAL